MLITLRGQRIESNFQISIKRTLGLNMFCFIMFDEHPLNPSDPDPLLLLPSPPLSHRSCLKNCLPQCFFFFKEIKYLMCYVKFKICVLISPM